MNFLANTDLTVKDLKSSMDRFIVPHFLEGLAHFKNLKSSMDRFIAISIANCFTLPMNLKSSMDRFIGGNSAVSHEIRRI